MGTSAQRTQKASGYVIGCCWATAKHCWAGPFFWSRGYESGEEAEIVARAIEAEADRIEADVGQEPAAPVNTAGDKGGQVTPRRSKKSTEKGEGRDKIIAALTKHHKYADGGCLNSEPIGNNELARLAAVSTSTTSVFFDKEFKGYARYRAVCGDTTRLVAALKLLNQEFAPHHLFGRNPPREGADNEEE